MIAPGYTDEALEILKQKKNGNYCVIEIDPGYEPAPIEQKDVFGITFEQGRNELRIDDDFFSNIVTDNYVTVTKIHSDGTFSVVDPKASEQKIAIPAKNMFGFDFISKAYFL